MKAEEALARLAAEATNQKKCFGSQAREEFIALNYI
jgi:hypothetical protein